MVMDNSSDDSDENTVMMKTLSRFASSNMKADWVKAAEEKNKVKASKGKKREQGGDSSDDDVDSEAGEKEQEDALLRDSSSLMGGKGGVLEPGYLNIVRQAKGGGGALGGVP